MPALTKSRLGSPRGRTGDDGTNRWPCLTRKKSTNALRIRAADSSGGGQPPSDRAERAQRWLGRPRTGQSLRWTSRNMRTTGPTQTDRTGPGPGHRGCLLWRACALTTVFFRCRNASQWELHRHLLLRLRTAHGQKTQDGVLASVTVPPAGEMSAALNRKRGPQST